MNIFISMAWPGWIVEAIPLVTDLQSAASVESRTRISKARTAKHSQEPTRSATGLSTSLIRNEMHDQQRTDDITVYYDCPYVGHAHNTFRVRTQYDVEDNRVSFHEVFNVNVQFRDTWQSEQNPLEIEFETWLKARHCIRHNPHLACAYKYKIFIEGAVAPGILDSAVVYDHNHQEVEPSVTEKCRSRTHGPQETCPIETTSQPCTILDVVSTPVH